MTRRDEVEGLVLCQVGGHRLAFVAAHMASIGSWEVSDAPLPQARFAYGLPVGPGKLLIEEGAAVVVDSIEVSAERWRMMPVPSMLLGAVGGALLGFIAAADGLTPVLKLPEFSRFVVAAAAALGARR